MIFRTNSLSKLDLLLPTLLIPTQPNQIKDCGVCEEACNGEGYQLWYDYDEIFTPPQQFQDPPNILESPKQFQRSPKHFK